MCVRAGASAASPRIPEPRLRHRASELSRVSCRLYRVSAQQKFDFHSTVNRAVKPAIFSRVSLSSAAVTPWDRSMLCCGDGKCEAFLEIRSKPLVGTPEIAAGIPADLKIGSGRKYRRRWTVHPRQCLLLYHGEPELVPIVQLRLCNRFAISRGKTALSVREVDHASQLDWHQRIPCLEARWALNRLVSASRRTSHDTPLFFQPSADAAYISDSIR